MLMLNCFSSLTICLIILQTISQTYQRTISGKEGDLQLIVHNRGDHLELMVLQQNTYIFFPLAYTEKFINSMANYLSNSHINTIILNKTFQIAHIQSQMYKIFIYKEFFTFILFEQISICNDLSKLNLIQLYFLAISWELILIMNKIFITNSQSRQESTVYTVSLQQANQMLPILRSDHFREIVIEDLLGVDTKNLKFLVQLTRLLRNDGEIVLRGEVSEQILILLKNLNLFEGEKQGQNKIFCKTKPIPKEVSRNEKLSIGFQSNESEQQIDQSQLLKDEGLQIGKKKVQNCDTKPRACANCNCSRKEGGKVLSKEQLIDAINEGKPASGCGKCSLGDSFRCGTCPYKGLPAFKPGDKLKLVQEGGVVVESSSTFVSVTGKVKLEI